MIHVYFMEKLTRMWKMEKVFIMTEKKEFSKEEYGRMINLYLVLIIKIKY